MMLPLTVLIESTNGTIEYSEEIKELVLLVIGVVLVRLEINAQSK